MNWETIGIWTAALITLAIYSFLYKDNPFYKLVEHLFIGVSTGYLVVIRLSDALRRDVFEPVFRNEPREYIVIVPAILGILMFTRFISRISWVSRISIALIVGVTAGIAIPNVAQTYLLKHTEATLTPLVAVSSSENWRLPDLVAPVLILLGVLSVLIYFFFSVPRKGPIRGMARTGMIFLMLFFGAAFGYTVTGRVSLLIGRMRFLLTDWIGLGG